ncbi:MAG: sulfite reductase, dissimilatory-type subunit alpha, partial [Proteobacteria bacterium]|nr:sulfite reductase, dissimilatory-type subunit alpha [Pseudomonadota bacterium]
VKVEEPYDELHDIIGKVWDYWMEEGKNRERVGELIKRNGMQEMLKRCDLEPIPQHVQEPRANPYIFWREDEVPGGWKRDIVEFRKHHQR